MKRKIIPGQIPTKDLHQFMIGAVSPRPIAFVSTVDENGLDNLAPYSFFNAFSSNPPIVVFSSNRRVSNNTTKDTLHNLQVNKEVVVNVVSFNIVRQMSIASAEYPHEVSEWEKSGLTKEDADFIKPKLVKESPVNMECKVKDIITLGDEGGAGHLIICDVIAMHIDENILDGDRIDPHKIDLMGRMGRTFYVRASGNAVISMHQPVTDLPVGFDALPDCIRLNQHLTGNEIGIIAALNQLPDVDLTSIDSNSHLDETTFIAHIKEKLANSNAVEAYLEMVIYYNKS